MWTASVRNPKKQSSILIICFLAERKKVDLNEIYGTKINVTQQSLINILESYNLRLQKTPIEEEIALDPNWLGKVFENCGELQPETQTTAETNRNVFTLHGKL